MALPELSSETEPRIMRDEFSDYEWTAIKPMLPNKPRGVRRVNDSRVLDGTRDLRAYLSDAGQENRRRIC